MYVKGYQKNPHTPKILPRRDRAPGFEIPGSAPVNYLVNWLNMTATDCGHYLITR